MSSTTVKKDDSSKTATPEPLVEKKYSSGHDPKSILINLATTLVFIFPFVAYLYTEYAAIQGVVTVGALLFAYMVPPMGWMRPHPYSDMPSNRPKTS